MTSKEYRDINTLIVSFTCLVNDTDLAGFIETDEDTIDDEFLYDPALWQLSDMRELARKLRAFQVEVKRQQGLYDRD